MKNIQVKQIAFTDEKSYITLVIPPYLNHTSQINGFGEVLLAKMPNLRQHICHNQKQITFSEEVNQTELAHVFEHMLLELVYQKDKNLSKLRAWTVWDWKKDPKWHYVIEIDYTKRSILFSCLRDAFMVLNDVLVTCKSGVLLKKTELT